MFLEPQTAPISSWTPVSLSHNNTITYTRSPQTDKGLPQRDKRPPQGDTGPPQRDTKLSPKVFTHWGHDKQYEFEKHSPVNIQELKFYHGRFWTYFKMMVGQSEVLGNYQDPLIHISLWQSVFGWFFYSWYKNKITYLVFCCNIHVQCKCSWQKQQFEKVY